MEALANAEFFESVRIASAICPIIIRPVVQAAGAFKLSEGLKPLQSTGTADVAPMRHRRRPAMNDLGFSIRDRSYLRTEHRHAYVAFGQVAVLLLNSPESETEQAGLQIRFALSEASRPGTRRCSTRDDSL